MKNIRVRHPQHFVVGEGSIVDDFCYFSTKVTIGRFSHVAAGCTVTGGGERQFALGDYCSLSSGLRIWCTSDDFISDVVCILLPGVSNVEENPIVGDVTIGNYTAVGSNTVIMPGNDIPEGSVVGAMSYVPPRFKFKPWSVYAGIRIRLVGSRNRESVLR